MLASPPTMPTPTRTLLLLCISALVSTTHALTNESLRAAVRLYLANPDINRGYRDISLWDTSDVTDMSDLFKNTDFNADISGWNVSQVTNFNGMFFGATSFDQKLDAWDVSAASNMDAMFKGATSYSHSLCWDLHPEAKAFEMFCRTDGAQFEHSISQCPHAEHYLSIYSYSQACENDIQDEIESRGGVAGQPEHDNYGPVTTGTNTKDQMEEGKNLAVTAGLQRDASGAGMITTTTIFTSLLAGTTFVWLVV